MSAQKRKRSAQRRKPKVLVLSNDHSTLSAEEIITMARRARATSVDKDGETLYWIKWPGHNVYEMTANAIRQSVSV